MSGESKKPYAMAERILPDYYEASVEQLVGRFTLLCGQLDRLMASALTRVTNPPMTVEESIAVFRGFRNGQGMMVGSWLRWLGETANQQRPGINKEWADEARRLIEAYKDMRDRVSHDCLVLNPDEQLLEWKTSEGRGSREHEDFDMQALHQAIASFYALKNFLYNSGR